MGLGKKQGLKRCMIFINLKGIDACSAEFDRMSKNSAKIIQYLYDGVYEHKIDSVSRELYLADLQEIKNEDR